MIMKLTVETKLILFSVFLFLLVPILSSEVKADICSSNCYDYSYCPYGSPVGYSNNCKWPIKCCKTSAAIAQCKGSSSPPPPCPPPAPPAAVCGDNSCNGGETCSSCSQDCGRCDPQMSNWCERNCYASNSPASGSHLYCGQGWLGWSNMYCQV